MSYVNKVKDFMFLRWDDNLCETKEVKSPAMMVYAALP